MSEPKYYMHIATGSVDTFNGWWYHDENGELVNAVERCEVVEVVRTAGGEWGRPIAGCTNGGRMMGEAKRRKKAVPAKTEAKHETLTYPRKWLNDDFGFEPVAATLAGLQIHEAEGVDCLYRHYFASRHLLELGYETTLTFGIVGARVGLKPTDVLTWFDPETHRFKWDKGIRGHVWLSHIGDSELHFADFTVGNWPRTTVKYKDGLPPVDWNVKLPDHWWLDAKKLPSFIHMGKEDDLPAENDFPLGGVFYGMHTVLNKDMMNEHAEVFESLDKDYMKHRDELMRTTEYHQKHWRGRK